MPQSSGKIVQHYGYSFEDVIAENIYATNMAAFLNVSTYRKSLYKKGFPTGSWLEVKGLALPGLMIEIDMEAHKATKESFRINTASRGGHIHFKFQLGEIIRRMHKLS